MKSYNRFIFDKYTFDPAEGRIELIYSLDDEVQFIETLIIPKNCYKPNAISPALDAALFALHLIGGISYYKTCLPKEIVIRSGKLSGDQAKFWHQVYENGLGEFFYKNEIEFERLIKFPSEISTTPALTPNVRTKKGMLVPIGGGKDSLVTIETLKKAGADVTLFRMGHHPLIDELAKIAGLPLLTVERHLSPALFKLNADGALNGHIPITAYLSFLTVVIAELCDFEAIVMSNERSANIGNVEYRGKVINHQWSKSEEFETLFQDYVRTWITPSVEYSSALRTMTELQISEQFVHYPQYFTHSTSCNANWKILAAPRGRKSGFTWCGTCPKCAFVFALYAAFLPKKTLVEIFGKNLFDDASLLPLYKELLGVEGFKPFECVGTPEETKEAFSLAQKRGDLNETIVMKMFSSL